MFETFFFISTLKILWLFLSIIDFPLSQSACATLKVNRNNELIEIPVGDRDIRNDGRRINVTTKWRALKDSPVISVNIQSGCLFRMCTYITGKFIRSAQMCHEKNTSTEFSSSTLSSMRWNGTASSVLSFDCSCKENCKLNAGSNCSFIGTTLEEDECARLYQETNCESCRFEYISLRKSIRSLWIKGMSMMSSMAVRDNCSVGVYGNRNVLNENAYFPYTSKLGEKSDINKENYGIRSFNCHCNGEGWEENRIIPDFRPDYRNETNIVVISVGSVVLIVVIAITVTVITYKCCKNNHTRLKLSLAVQYQSKHIKRLSLRDLGHFGVVYDGILKTKAGKLETVALKYVKSYSNPVYLNSIISEIKIMDAIGKHPNIVGFLGSCTQCESDGDICIIMELCEKGSLKKYLENEDVQSVFRDVFETNTTHMHYVRFAEETDTRTCHLSTANLVKWCLDIAAGMEFISIKNIVHFDLAIRNILLTADLTAKISDFGLSQNLQKSGYLTFNQQGKSSIPLPVLYMAPESLTLQRLSIKSDVWAYGVCVWEIFSLGDYPTMGEDINLSDVNVRDTLAKKFASGHRLQRPQFSSPEIYSKILKCWDMSPPSRPSFQELKEFFECQVEMVNDIVNVSQFPTGAVS